MESQRMRRAVLAVLVLSIAMVTGCRNKQQAEDEAEQETARLRIGALMPDLSDPRLDAIARGMRREADEQDAELILVETRNDVKVERAELDVLLEQHPRAVILCPVDGDESQAVVGACAAEGVPVVTLERKLNDAEGVDAHVGVDPQEAAEKQWEIVADLTPQPRQAILLVARESDSQTLARVAALELLLQSKGLTSVERQMYDNDKETLREQCDALVASTPAEAAMVVFADRDPVAVTYGRAASRHDRSKLTVVGYGGRKSAIEAVKERVLAGTVVHDFQHQGQLAIRTAVAKSGYGAVSADEKKEEELTLLENAVLKNVDTFRPMW